jgi:hypothetical protein
LRRKHQREYHQKHREEILKRQKQYYLDHKTWLIRNCLRCGKFLPEKHSKYCSSCEILEEIGNSKNRSKEYHKRKVHQMGDKNMEMEKT